MNTLRLLVIIMTLAGAVQADRILTPFSARYQLVMDGNLVGHAYVELKIKQDDAYQFEIFTVPAGSSTRDARAQEVYEVSKGRFNLGIPVPESYFYSSGKGQMTRTLHYTFDWQSGKLTIGTQRETAITDLVANAQDRLSYLLLSIQLTEPQEPAKVVFPLIGLQQQKATELIRGGKAVISVPAGNIAATEIKRQDGDDAYYRHLWFSDNAPRLPVLIEVQNSAGLLRMELLKAD